MKKYNIINNSLGWFCFLVAAITYLLTLEPTASFWDCPEFISQGLKLEVGHPPGNPIFILAARFFINFAGGDPAHAAVAVNVMSALLSAATILLLFWTITHFVRRLMVGRSEEELPMPKLIVVMASGLCGALAYTWSDTFWFSAVEGEVYAFSSFCTALVIWLMLKWDNRADKPHSDRYLILVAYIIGISIAVHLLNLLTIPALALLVYYRKAKKATLGKSLIALVVSFVIVALILYGLVPGFVENAQYFELFFVNVLGLGYNIGVLVYAIILIGVLIWCLISLSRQNSLIQIRISFILSVILSGIPFIGSSLIIPAIIIVGLCLWIFLANRLSVRLLNLIVTSILVIFIGYSSYALLLIRSHANPPMNQNSPDNVFALSSYLNREQYGQTPLLYGQSFGSAAEAYVDPSQGKIQGYIMDETPGEYTKQVSMSSDDPDRYVRGKTVQQYRFVPKMFFPRMYSSQGQHPAGYLSWIGETMESLPTVEATPYYDKSTGDVLKIYGRPYTVDVPKPSFGQNLRYFFSYQLNHMYWRYFMWNFAGRQNDLQGNGELNRGNWISGIPFIDNTRLGDQSLLPDDIGKNNKGHNVFYMLPLLLGLLGIAAQMMRGDEGVRQFWVVFFLFFMTGIAIVLYLNQPPLQPRERDYAFAGSFYAFAIWIGLGIYALWLILNKAFKQHKAHMPIAVCASLIAVLVPLQMVSQTWDDHDRSGRYTARDFGMNYLSSVDENAIIFTNGDNDTFPLWYAQEVEGYRTDVRVVNLAYLTTDWYVNHMRMPANDAAAIDMSIKPLDYAYDRLQYNLVSQDTTVSVPVDVFASLRDLYESPVAVDTTFGMRCMRYPLMYIPVDKQQAVTAGIITAAEADAAEDSILVDLSDESGITLSQAASLDMLATSVANGWNRPVYFAMTVDDNLYLNLEPYMRFTGIAYQVTPLLNSGENGYEIGVATDKMYDNVINKFRWGGLDNPDKELYLDETVRRMVTTHRSALLELATALYNEGIMALYYTDTESNDGEANPLYREYADDRFAKSAEILDLMEEKLPVRHSPYAIQIGQRIGNLYVALGQETGNTLLTDKGLQIIKDEIVRYAPYIPYYSSLLRDLAPATSKVGRYSFGKTSMPTINSLNISNTDKYIPYYIYYLLQDYVKSGGDVEVLLNETLKPFGDDILGDLEALLPAQDSQEQDF